MPLLTLTSLCRTPSPPAPLLLLPQLGISLDPTGVPIPEPDYHTSSEQVARLRPIVANMAFTAAQVKMVVDAFEVGGALSWADRAEVDACMWVM